MSLKIKSFVYLIMLTAGVDSLARGEKCGVTLQGVKELKNKIYRINQISWSIYYSNSPGAEICHFLSH